MNVLAALAQLADAQNDTNATAIASILVPAAIAICIALLSTAVTIVTLVLKSRDDAAARRHQVSTSLLGRRVDALEIAWVEVFIFEQRGKPSRDSAELVKVSVWMSQGLQSAYVRLLASEAPTAGEFTNVRGLIQSDLKGLTS